MVDDIEWAYTMNIETIKLNKKLLKENDFSCAEITFRTTCTKSIIQLACKKYLFLF